MEEMVRERDPTRLDAELSDLIGKRSVSLFHEGTVILVLFDCGFDFARGNALMVQSRRDQSRYEKQVSVYVREVDDTVIFGERFDFGIDLIATLEIFLSALCGKTAFSDKVTIDRRFGHGDAFYVAVIIEEKRKVLIEMHALVESLVSDDGTDEYFIPRLTMTEGKERDTVGFDVGRQIMADELRLLIRTVGVEMIDVRRLLDRLAVNLHHILGDGVVAVDEHDVFSLRFVETEVSRVRRAAVFEVEYLTAVGIFVTDLAAAVRRAVVDEEHLAIGEVLSHETVETVAKVSSCIVNGNDERKSHNLL